MINYLLQRRLLTYANWYNRLFGTITNDALTKYYLFGQIFGFKSILFYFILFYLLYVFDEFKL